MAAPIGTWQIALPKVNHTGNVRDGLSFKLGIDRKGRVVHIYKDGTRVTLLRPEDKLRKLNAAPKPLPPEAAPHHELLREVARRMVTPGTHSTITSRGGMKRRTALPAFKPR
jgi:hypothetical protein